MLRSSRRIEFLYSHLFDETIVNLDLSTAFEQLLRAARRVETEPLWVPASWVQWTLLFWKLLGIGLGCDNTWTGWSVSVGNSSFTRLPIGSCCEMLFRCDLKLISAIYYFKKWGVSVNRGEALALEFSPVLMFWPNGILFPCVRLLIDRFGPHGLTFSPLFKKNFTFVGFAIVSLPSCSF